MAKQHEIFVEGCVKNSAMTKEEAEKIWELFVPFQGYGFNKAHAASYGIVSYQTGYMKANFPVEYMTALLTAEATDTDKVVEAIEECKKMAIVVLTPDINKSFSGFTIEENSQSLEGRAIRFGLNAIKNVGGAALDEILTARKDGEFKSFCDFYMRVNGQKVNRKVLESLIKAGAMDKFGKRAAMLAGLDSLRQKCDALSKQRSQGQVGLFDTGEDTSARSIPDDNFPGIDEFKKEELMRFEKELLGFYLTDNPLSSLLLALETEVGSKIRDLIDSEEALVGQKVSVGGIISTIRVVVTKKNNSEMAFATIEDGTGKIEIVVFPKTYGLDKTIWEKDKVVIVKGKLEKRDEEYSVIVDEGKRLNGDEGKGYDFVIRVPKGTTSKTLMELNAILKGSPGDKMGVLIFENGGAPRKLELSFGIDFNPEILEQIKSLLNI
jgi:DNA polymerase-3 subunit alpha